MSRRAVARSRPSAGGARPSGRRADQAALDATGIRTLRAKPVFTTPDAFAPTEVGPDAIDETRWAAPADRIREAIEPQHCYVCKQQYTAIHHFYDQLCPAVRRPQLREAHRDRPTSAGAWRSSPAAA